MRTFAWDSKYLLGIPELDNQHKKLFIILRELQLECYGDTSMEFLIEKITEIQCYCYEHFAAEEVLMRTHRANLPMMEEHLAQHANFIAVTNGFALRVKTEGSKLAHELCAYLGAWLVSHIYTMDKRTFSAVRALEDSNPVAGFERGYGFESETTLGYQNTQESVQDAMHRTTK